MCLLLVDHLEALELLVLLILDITKEEYEILALPWLQRHLDIM